jgi:hypothetical protein
MVDYEPWDGDYTDTHVHHNTIAGLGSYLKVGINVGPATWSDDTDSIVHSGKVTHNTITGDAMGYGIVVASAKGFTVMDNKSTAKYSGVMGERCPRAPPNGEPTAFLINQGSAEGIFQNDFVNGEVQHGPYRPGIVPFRIADDAEQRTPVHSHLRRACDK